MEGAGLLDFGIPRTSFNAPPPLLLFYSRRIGIEEGHAIPILAGGKVTGKVGGFGVGLLNVLTDKYAADATENVDAVDVDRRELLRLANQARSFHRVESRYDCG